MGELLLDNDMNVNLINQTGQSPIQVAAMNGHNEVIKFLAEKGAEIGPAVEAMQKLRAKQEAEQENQKNEGEKLDAQVKGEDKEGIAAEHTVEQEKKPDAQVKVKVRLAAEQAPEHREKKKRRGT